MWKQATLKVEMPQSVSWESGDCGRWYISTGVEQHLGLEWSSSCWGMCLWPWDIWCVEKKSFKFKVRPRFCLYQRPDTRIHGPWQTRASCWGEAGALGLPSCSPDLHAMLNTRQHQWSLRAIPQNRRINKITYFVHKVSSSRHTTRC